jgi:hypothetical protein
VAILASGVLNVAHGLSSHATADYARVLTFCFCRYIIRAMNDDIVGRELPPSYQTIVRHDGKKVCPICYWPMADSWTAGCVPGNCSYRPTPGTPEWESIQRKSALRRDPHRRACRAGRWGPQGGEYQACGRGHSQVSRSISV